MKVKEEKGRAPLPKSTRKRCSCVMEDGVCLRPAVASWGTRHGVIYACQPHDSDLTEKAVNRSLGIGTKPMTGRFPLPRCSYDADGWKQHGCQQPAIARWQFTDGEVYACEEHDKTMEEEYKDVTYDVEWRK